MKQVLAAQAVAIYCVDDNGEHLEMKSAVGIFESEVKIGVNEAGSPVAQTYDDHRPRSLPPSRDIAPILYADTAQGVLCVDGMNADDEEERQTKLNTLWSLAQEAALLFRVARVTTDLADGIIEIDELLGIDS